MSYSRDDVKTHYGSDRPAVNVKVRAWPFWAGVDFDGIAGEEGAPGFSEAWIEAHLSPEHVDGVFWRTCENEWEQLAQDAAEVFGDYRVTVEQDGRSGGWAVVRGLPDLGEWDAVLLGKWRRFERYARSIADGIPELMAETIAINQWQSWRAAYVFSFGDVGELAAAA
jgi:hypothetical protein